MRASIEFLAALLDDDDPHLASEDLEGEHHEPLSALIDLGILITEPYSKRFSACPHCDDGVLHSFGEQVLCNACRSVAYEGVFRCWRLDREAFFSWTARALSLRGAVRRVDDHLWQLGTHMISGDLAECFFRARGSLSEHGRARLRTYRNTIVIGNAPLAHSEPRNAHYLTLADVVMWNGRFTVTLGTLSRPRGAVRFDEDTGILWVGEAAAGEVTIGSKEFYFLRCLSRELGKYVVYADLKRDILRLSGRMDTTEEATFCQKLKSRMKNAIPAIDQLITTTNKGDGYRLRMTVDVT